ncbi:hypothetical protein Ae406Ps2_6298 [Pseudonocardia sp. Ae406_Ps2]|nr:hypothetical protein Ae406Ps2_6298 [Pseudonocardia sp. Ae406_Ps2]OLM08445.1 hypothetical protein Ae505Ps2_6151 [Pseudonocardia sp. Ae505_Ps2]
MPRQTVETGSPLDLDQLYSRAPDATADSSGGVR